MRDSVAGIFKKHNKFLVGKRKSGGDIGGLWEFPGGKVRFGESHTEALIREFMEELSVDIIVEDFIANKEFFHNEKKYSLNAYYIKFDESKIKKKQHTAFKWLSLEEIVNLKDNFVNSDKLLLNHL